MYMYMYVYMYYYYYIRLPTSRDLLVQLYHSVPSIIDLIPINALKPYSVLSIPSEVRLG